MRTGKAENKQLSRQEVIRAHSLPTDCNIYIEEIEKTLMNCFNQWRQVTAAVYRYLGEEQSQRVRGLDCVEWFCASTKARLEELRRQDKYPELSETIV